jgi:hypothetical protein
MFAVVLQVDAICWMEAMREAVDEALDPGTPVGADPSWLCTAWMPWMRLSAVVAMKELAGSCRTLEVDDPLGVLPDPATYIGLVMA